MSKIPFARSALSGANTLILPAEIASRELDARLLHGVLALERGWRVIVGSKALLNRAIWRFPPSLYLCQTLTHKRLTMLKLLDRLGHVTFGWDDEGLIYLDRDVYLMRRVSSESLARLSGLVAWGQTSADHLALRSSTLGLSPRPFGNPRFDLLRPELRALYADEVAALTRRHGNFVLVDTNFASSNPIVSQHDLPARAISDKDLPVAGERDRFAQWRSHRDRLFALFQQDLPQLAARNAGVPFVVRPHPSEDSAAWTEVFRGVSNVEVIREGPSIPWLIAARTVIHNNCTTAVEAAIIGRTPIAYCPARHAENDGGLPNSVSHVALDVDGLSAAVRLALDGRLEVGTEQHAALRRYVSGLSGPLATEAILDWCDELYDANADRKAVPFAARMTARFKAMLRNRRKSRRTDHFTDRYLEKVFPPTDAGTVARRATQIAAALGRPVGVAAREITQNVFELSLERR